MKKARGEAEQIIQEARNSAADIRQQLATEAANLADIAKALIGGNSSAAAAGNLNTSLQSMQSDLSPHKADNPMNLTSLTNLPSKQMTLLNRNPSPKLRPKKLLRTTPRPICLNLQTKNRKQTPLKNLKIRPNRTTHKTQKHRKNLLSCPTKS